MSTSSREPPVTTSLGFTMTSSPPAGAGLCLARPAPTLTAAQADLGHHCTGTCADAVDALGAQLWFVRRRSNRLGRGPASLVVVDASEYEGSRERSRQLMRAINDCLRPDGIRMSERRIDDCGVALALVRPLPHDAPDHRPPTTPLSLVRMPS